MSETKHDDGLTHAFPHLTLESSGVIHIKGGLSKRELFAAMALQGFIAGCYAGNNAGFTVQGNVVASLEYADELIRQLSPEGDER